jgi:hypothetical protein
MQGCRAHYVILFLSLIVALPCHAKILYHGQCIVKSDPASNAQPVISACINAEARAIAVQKSKTPQDNQSPNLYIARGRASLFLSPYLSAHASARTLRYEDRKTHATIYRETAREDVVLQLGNNALSRHRINAGYGRPMIRIDHNQRRDIEYPWDISKFESSFVKYGTYTYDNQLDLTFQATYGQLLDDTLDAKQRAFGAGRIMYDLAALEGTRIVVGGSSDGLLRRAANIGMININGKNDETALEVTRTFSQRLYDPDEFQQLIRLSYISHIQDNSQIKAQYDDIFRKYRIGSIGVMYHYLKFGFIELHTGYAKNEVITDQSHWFGILIFGAKS